MFDFILPIYFVSQPECFGEAKNIFPRPVNYTKPCGLGGIKMYKFRQEGTVIL